MRRTLEFAFLWFGMLIGLGLCAGSPHPPNFVVILADDLGYGDLGVYGQKEIRTPNLDQMASEGVRLTEFYTVAPTCTPSRVGLLTGRYPSRSGLVRVLVPKEKWGIPSYERTLGEVLQDLGYATACIGKWHLGGRLPYRPVRNGFDFFYGLLHSNDMTLLPIVKWPRVDLLRGDEVIESPARLKTLTQRYTERAVEFIQANRRRPFFLYLAHTLPHSPFRPSRAFRGRSSQGPYGDAVEEIDWSTGRVLDALTKNNLDDRTLVIFSSDNGPWVAGASKKKTKGGSAGHLRGGKGTTWEGGVRVPFIARWPGHLPAGSVRKGLATNLDVFTTLVELADGEIPPDRLIDGKNISALLEGKGSSPHRTVFYYLGEQVSAVRKDSWKLHLFKRELGHRGKLLDRVRCLPAELYDLSSDPSEQSDRASDRPELVAQLSAMARQFQSSIQPTMRLPSRRKSVFSGIMTQAPKDPNKVPR